jgi:hypothetical protein
MKRTFFPSLDVSMRPAEGLHYSSTAGPEFAALIALLLYMAIRSAQPTPNIIKRKYGPSRRSRGGDIGEDAAGRAIGAG